MPRITACSGFQYVAFLALVACGGGGTEPEPEPEPEVSVSWADANTRSFITSRQYQLSVTVQPANASCTVTSTHQGISAQLSACNTVSVSVGSAVPEGAHSLALCATLGTKKDCENFAVSVERQKVPSVQYGDQLSVFLNKEVEINPSSIQDVDACQAALLGGPNTSTYRDDLAPDIVGESLTNLGAGKFLYLAGNARLEGGAVERSVEVTCSSTQTGSVPAKDTIRIRRDVPRLQISRFEGYLCETSPTQPKFFGAGETFVANNNRGQYGTNVGLFPPGVSYDPPGMRPIIINPNEMYINFGGLTGTPRGTTERWTVVATNGTESWQEIGTIDLRGAGSPGC